MASLFKISNELQLIVNDIIENGGEISEGMENTLMITEDQLKAKAIDYGIVIRAMEYDNSIVDEEIKRLTQIKKVRTNTAERLKTALSEALIKFDVDEVASATMKINFRKSQVLEIIDEAKIDKKYKISKVTVSIDKMSIKRDIKNGEMISGVQLITNQNLQIK